MQVLPLMFKKPKCLPLFASFLYSIKSCISFQSNIAFKLFLMEHIERVIIMHLCSHIFFNSLHVSLLLEDTSRFSQQLFFFFEFCSECHICLLKSFDIPAPRNVQINYFPARLSQCVQLCLTTNIQMFMYLCILFVQTLMTLSSYHWLTY